MQPNNRPARVRLLATAFSACSASSHNAKPIPPRARTCGLAKPDGRFQAPSRRKTPQRARKSKAPERDATAIGKALKAGCVQVESPPARSSLILRMILSEKSATLRDHAPASVSAHPRDARIAALPQPRAEEVRPVRGLSRPVSPQTMVMTLMMRMMIRCSDNIGAVGAIFSTGHSQDCSDAAKDATRHPANNSTDDTADRSKYLIPGARSGVSTLTGTRRDTLSVRVGRCDRNSADPNDKTHIRFHIRPPRFESYTPPRLRRLAYRRGSHRDQERSRRIARVS